MRKIVSIVVTILLLSGTVAPVFSQDEKKETEDKNSKQPKIEGSGNLVTRDIAIQPFEQLDASGVFNVSLAQGSKESLRIEAEDNLQGLFEVKSEGNKLSVSMKKNVRYNSRKRMTVYITFKNLKGMNLAMVGNLSSEGNLSFDELSLENKSVGSVELNLTAKKLDIKNESVGGLRLKGKVEEAVIRSNSVGSIKAGDLVVQTMDIDNNGVGSAEVNAAKELKVRDSFLGKVKNVSNENPKRINKVVI